MNIFHHRAVDRHHRRPRGQPGLAAIGREIAFDDCLVDRFRPFLIRIFEPLATHAPCPALAQPHCCYINTVIFYYRPYVTELAQPRWRGPDGVIRDGMRGFQEWETVETRLRWDDVVRFEGENFTVSGGWVIWAAVPGDPVGRRWWMAHGARRVPT